ncbi:MAG: hypothetical protein PHY64_13930 [Eubacteriales bacterium]|nr:hypothetical protein [Eubacteriales bacterium]
MAKKTYTPLILLLCAMIAFSASVAIPSTTAWAAEASSEAETVEAKPFYLQGSELVYVTATGKRYHRTDHCGNTQHAYLLSLEEACRLGYTPCGNCHPTAFVKPDEDFAFPEGSIIVYITMGDECYHASPDCSNCQNGVAVTLEEARHLGKEPCKQCKPSQ